METVLTSDIYLFTGAGNRFVICDGRRGGRTPSTEAALARDLCRKYGTDGMMVLDEAPGTDSDFSMAFYNPDGSGGMMCGNGGRCIVALADHLGIRPAGDTWRFLAPDGPHTARILAHPQEKLWTVRLKMKDVPEVRPLRNGLFLDTGTRHWVSFVEDVDAVDVAEQGKAVRWDPAFAPEGTNVNFVSLREDGLHVRTFEKGVEGETLACGTGLTASAIAACVQGLVPAADPAEIRLFCRRGDALSVSFRRAGKGFQEVYLTGPAELLSES